MDIHEQQRETSWVTRRWKYLRVVSHSNTEAQRLVDDSYIPAARKHFESLRASYVEQTNSIQTAIEHLNTHVARLDREEEWIRKPFETAIAEAYKIHKIADIPQQLLGVKESEDDIEQRERRELARLKAKYESS